MNTTKNIENFGQACESLSDVFLFQDYKKVSDTKYLLSYKFFKEVNEVKITYEKCGDRVELKSDCGNTKVFYVTNYTDAEGVCDTKSFIEEILNNLKDVISNDAIVYCNAIRQYVKHKLIYQK